MYQIVKLINKLDQNKKGVQVNLGDSRPCELCNWRDDTILAFTSRGLMYADELDSYKIKKIHIHYVCQRNVQHYIKVWLLMNLYSRELFYLPKEIIMEIVKKLMYIMIFCKKLNPQRCKY